MADAARLIAALLLATASASAGAADFHVRIDGGDAAQCDGRADRALTADGRCAWKHPFFALPPGGQPKLVHGDTLHIAAGDYRMGFGAPGAEACSNAFPWDCVMPPLPSGTRVLGDCDRKPVLWGSERAQHVLDLSAADDVEVACLELTDRSSCVENHCHGGACAGEVARCEREAFPYGDWAGTGLRALRASNVRLRDLDIHGFALRGVHAGGLRDWRVQRVRIAGNGQSGWDGDIGEGSANAGTLHFEDVEIAWNGCAERYPDREAFGCWGQSSGGYGDGLGTAATGGAWTFLRANIHHNASDGLDLLYLQPGASVEVTDSRLEGNGGNQLKASHRATVRGSTVRGNCTALRARGLAAGDLCRAGGNAMVFALGDEPVRVEGNTVTGEGDCLLVTERGGKQTRVTIARNRFGGAPLWNDPSRTACGVYAHEGTPTLEQSDNEFLHTR